MASLKTLQRTLRIRERLSKIMRPYNLGSVLFDGSGIVTDWGTGHLAEMRRIEGPSLLERTYQQLSPNLLRKFVLVVPEETPEPTETEFAMFEKRLLGAARRLLKQDFETILEELSPYRHSGHTTRPRGATNREVIYREKIDKIHKTVRMLENNHRKRTQAVKVAAERLGYPERTIWRCLKKSPSRREV